WWELLVQLADFSQLRGAADRLGHEVRIEDDLMDVTVWAGDELLLYVENKMRASEASSLVDRMKAYGASGFDMESVAAGNDALKKCRYLFREDRRPRYFGASAVGFRKLFRIEYAESQDCRFDLHELDEPFTEPLSRHPPHGAPPDPSRGSPLALAFERRFDQKIWTSPGTGQTAINIYSTVTAGDAILVGLYRNGTAWTATKEFGEDVALSLSNALGRLGIDFDPTRGWTQWRRGEQAYVVSDDEAEAIAEAVGTALGDTVPS
ncbi:MAG: hypothetical protein ACF8XB_21100, partial [Planctomycetota bacterium JB042]